MFDLKDEFIYIIKKVHEWLKLPCDEAKIAIMMGTAATETHLGRDFRQLKYSMESDGGAFSPWGIEIRTHDDVQNIVLSAHPMLCERVNQIKGCMSGKDALIGNLYYACAIARLQYWRHPEPLPLAEDLVAQGYYYKKYFNSSDGKGSMKKYVEDYKCFVLK
jgi:hypothetical protein